MAVLLPDDLLLEILLRLKDAAALFRCATACKQWRSLVADRSFLGRCWPEGACHSSTFVGFFTRDNYGKGHAGSFPAWEPCFVPAPRSALDPCCRALGSFVKAAGPGLFKHAAPLVSRHGLIVVRLKSHNTPGYQDPTILQLMVCNVLDGTYAMLPALKFCSDFNNDRSNGYAILTRADFSPEDDPSAPVQPSNSSLFKVVIIASNRHDKKYNLCLFSSDKASWSMHDNCFGSDAQRKHHGMFSEATVRRGTAHWIFRNYGELSCYMIILNARTGHISMMKFPFEMDYQLMSRSCLALAIDGSISLLQMQRKDHQLDIWEQENQQNIGRTSEWLHTRTIELKQPEEDTLGRELCLLREKCGILLINDCHERIYTANLETKKIKMMDWPHEHFIYTWGSMPLEIDWPAIFVSRLTRDSMRPPLISARYLQ